MRKIIVSEFITLDGVIEDPGGAEKFERGGWTFLFDRGADGAKFKQDELFACDALLLGRKTYEGFATAWPTMSSTGDFGMRMNSIRKFVVSKTLKKLEWNNSTLIGKDIFEEISKLKTQPGKDILVAGSAALVRALVQHNLVDEYRLMIFPIILGKGKTLFIPDGSGVAKTLQLTGSKLVGKDGVIILTYQSKK